MDQATGQTTHIGWLFSTTNYFADFVRVHGSGVTSESGFVLYVVDTKEGPQLLLSGDVKKRLSPLDGVKCKFSVADNGLMVAVGRRKAVHMSVVSQRKSTVMTELFALSPWLCPPENVGYIIFRSKKADRISDIVRDSFTLDNDRIQYIVTADKTHLLRIDRASWYLIERAQQRHADEVEVFYQATANRYVPWGLEHPLLDIWQVVGVADGNWLFYQPNGEHHQLEDAVWQDVYNATDFELVTEVKEAELQDFEQKPEFEVKLQLQARSIVAEASLWMFGEEGLPVLENLLSVVDQQQLKNIMLSAQQTESGEPVYFVREKMDSKKQGGSYLDFGGQAFASYKGFHNLFVPADRELYPQLRRDRYQDLFALKPGVLSVLMSDGETIFRLAESSFGPLSNLVDYLFGGAEDQLQELMKSSVFDFGRYAKAPSRPDLQPPQGKERQVGQAQVQQQVVQTSKAKQPDDEEAVDLLSEIPQAEEAQLAAETQLERDIIKKGQSADRWGALSNIKVAVHNPAEAHECLVEALWLEEGQGVDDLLNAWRKVVLARVDLKQVLGLANEPEKLRPLDTAAYVLAASQQPDWLANAARLLRHHEHTLRVKELWLLWRQVLQQNQDQREQARLKEDVRDRITDDGLSVNDLPGCIRNRLFRDRHVQAEGGEDDARLEVDAVYKNLRALQDSFDGFKVENVTNTLNFMLGRAFVMGLSDRASTEAMLPNIFDESSDTIIEQFGKLGNTVATWQALYLRDIREDETVWEEYYSLHIEGLGRREKALMEEQLETLNARKDSDDAASFLSGSNYQRFYPKNSKRDEGPSGLQIQAIQASRSKGEPEHIAREIRLGLKQVLQEKDLIEQARLLDAIVDAMNAIKWQGVAAPVMAEFEATAKNTSLTSDEPFYQALKNNSLALGMLAVGNEVWALDVVRQTLQDIGKRGADLDFIDAGSAALNSIQNFNLQSRKELIEIFCEGFIERFGKRNADLFADHPMAPYIYQLLDQAVEASISKDKLALTMFREYQQQDEFLVLDRVLREDLCATE